MSMDVLKNKIRKLRNPSALTIAPTLDTLPPAYEGIAGMGEYCRKVLEALKGVLPAVKISFSHFALLGCEGLQELRSVLDTAGKLGYYVILDWQRQEDEASAKAAAKLLFSGELWPCDAVVLSGYPGSASVKPYIQEANAEKKDIFVVLKTAGKGYRAIGLDPGTTVAAARIVKNPDEGVRIELSDHREITISERRLAGGERGGKGRLLMRRGTILKVVEDSQYDIDQPNASIPSPSPDPADPEV